MKTAVNYSRIIAGTMTWGDWGKQFDTSEMARMMNFCLEVGISTFDHADIYGGYTTEADFGKAFSGSGISRPDIQLISKCGIQYPCENRKLQVKHYEYNSEYIIRSAEASLTNLRTDYLDLLLLHRPSPMMHPKEVARAFDALKAGGKVREFGVSNFTPSQIRLIESETDLCANQFECSLTAYEALFDGVLDDCIIGKRLAMAWSPLGSYFREDNDQNSRIRKCLADLGKKYEVGESQLLLAWLLQHPAKIYPVIGTTTRKRIEESLKALELNLKLEDWFAMLVASQGHKVP
ncbi:aldo/keto reductase [Robiginitalea sp. IMCC44478]|uniref:aldo/keto reductase n=1 Tax=Robiginitalea sp. IMCC44478 TaxID=3459122 RepID=UPI0040420184